MIINWKGWLNFIGSKKFLGQKLQIYGQVVCTGQDIILHFLETIIRT